MSSPFALPGSVAVVTGGTRGIGYSVAAKLLGMGARVVITGRDVTRVEAAARELAGTTDECAGLVCDLQAPRER